MKSPILGSSYVARSVNAADNRMVNLFPEIVPEGGKEPAFLQRAPGMSTGITIGGTGPISAMLAYTFGTSRFLVVVRGQFVHTSTNGAAFVVRGSISVASTDLLITMAHNDTQVFIANRLDNTAYVMTKAGFVITQEAGSVFGPDNIGVAVCAYLDGYFIFNQPESNRIYVSNLLDGTTINPLAWASADGSPDLTRAIAVINGELWVFGQTSIEVWSNVGTIPFPFAPIQGSFSETGIAAIRSVATLDNSLFWLGQDPRGKGIIYRTNGYRPERVSTHAIEWQIQNYSDISDAVAYTYQQDGHAFYILTFPTGNATWVYDVATQVWHERGAWNGLVFIRHISTCHALYEGNSYVGCTNGKVNILSNDVYTEPGVTTRWLRSWRALPPGQNNLKRTAHHSLQIDCETGNDTSGERTVSLRWSDDGGHTYNTERSVSLGAFGDYSKRVIFRRLGMTTQLRDRVYELSGIDSPIFIMGAELMLSPTDA